MSYSKNAGNSQARVQITDKVMPLLGPISNLLMNEACQSDQGLFNLGGNGWEGIRVSCLSCDA